MPTYHIEFINSQGTRVEAPGGLAVNDQWVEAKADGSDHPLFICPSSRVLYVKRVDDGEQDGTA